MATHPDMCVESLPRKPHVVTFDNALLALKLAPAARGQGAVLDGWTDPIGAHDKKVIEVEQAMLQEKELVGQRSWAPRLCRPVQGTQIGRGGSTSTSSQLQSLLQN